MTPAITHLRREADDTLLVGPYSVAEGHDYRSVAPYWWPDPSKVDGRPYVRRDGEINPEFLACDRHRLESMARAVETLALAYSILGEERYADRAAQLLRVWFLDEATRMNPHLEFAQAIPGICTGRGIGIIDTVQLRGIPAAIAMLEDSPAGRATDAAGLRNWFQQYLDWLRQSGPGQTEANERNNHGTWYDAQVAVFADFVGQEEIIERVARAALEHRVKTQIEPDGRQPHELSRTLSFNYAVFNLTGLMTLALTAERVGVDLWHAATEDGRGIRGALDWLLPYARGERAWSFPQIQPIEFERLVLPLRWGALRYDDDRYEDALQHLPGVDSRAHRVNLLYPNPP